MECAQLSIGWAECIAPSFSCVCILCVYCVYSIVYLPTLGLGTMHCNCIVGLCSVRVFGELQSCCWCVFSCWSSSVLQSVFSCWSTGSSQAGNGSLGPNSKHPAQQSSPRTSPQSHLLLPEPPRVLCNATPKDVRPPLDIPRPPPPSLR